MFLINGLMIYDNNYRGSQLQLNVVCTKLMLFMYSKQNSI